MQLNDNLARQIVARAMKILSFSVNVMDERGLIIASGNPERIHERHEGAVLALTENRVVEISEATALQLKGVRPGINLPIAYQGELIGVIGISGDPDEVRAYAELVRMTAELILEQAALTEQLQWDKRHKEELVLQLIRGEGRVDQLQQAARFSGWTWPSLGWWRCWRWRRPTLLVCGSWSISWRTRSGTIWWPSTGSTR